jgi:hypothetical protein
VSLRKPADETFESFVERQIRDAQLAGEFDQLPGFGKPLEDLGDLHDDQWWLRRKLQREQLSLLPPGLAIPLEVHRRRSRILQADREGDVRQALLQLNDWIRDANLSVTWGPPSTALPLNVEAKLDCWRATRRAAKSGSQETA